MKWQYAVLAFAIVSAVSAETYEEEEGDARLGYITVGSDGSTSIQNAVILGLFVLVLGALVLPLFGISLGALFGSSDSADTGYGYGYEQPTYEQGYQAPASGYQSFSKRSIEMLGPVLDALTNAKEKYEN